MPIQVPRLGRRGYNKRDWIGIPGGISPVAATVAAGGSVALSTAPTVGTLSGTWTYTSDDPRFTISGANLVVQAGLSAGVYSVTIKVKNGVMYTTETVVITVT